MPDLVNSKNLKDDSIRSTQKLKGTVYLKKGCIKKIDSLTKLPCDVSSRNDVIEKAIDFYFGYVTSQLSQDYLCSIFGQKMEGIIGTLGTRVSRGNYRYAVELEMLMRMLASVLRLSGDDYMKLRKKSIDEVKRLNGSVDIFKNVSEEEFDGDSE